MSSESDKRADRDTKRAITGRTDRDARKRTVVESHTPLFTPMLRADDKSHDTKSESKSDRSATERSGNDKNKRPQ